MLKNTEHLDAGETENTVSLKTVAGHCQSMLKGGEASEETPVGWNCSSIGKVLTLRAQGAEFDPLEITFLKVGYGGICL